MNIQGLGVTAPLYNNIFTATWRYRKKTAAEQCSKSYRLDKRDGVTYVFILMLYKSILYIYVDPIKNAIQRLT